MLPLEIWQEKICDMLDFTDVVSLRHVCKSLKDLVFINAIETWKLRHFDIKMFQDVSRINIFGKTGENTFISMKKMSHLETLHLSAPVIQLESIRGLHLRKLVIDFSIILTEPIAVCEYTGAEKTYRFNVERKYCPFLEAKDWLPDSLETLVSEDFPEGADIPSSLQRLIVRNMRASAIIGESLTELIMQDAPTVDEKLFSTAPRLRVLKIRNNSKIKRICSTSLEVLHMFDTKISLRDSKMPALMCLHSNGDAFDFPRLHQLSVKNTKIPADCFAADSKISEITIDSSVVEYPIHRLRHVTGLICINTKLRLPTTLENLVMQDCDILIERLPQLKQLHISGLTTQTCIDNLSDSPLETLILKSLPELDLNMIRTKCLCLENTFVTQEGVAFLQVNKLSIVNCPYITSINHMKPRSINLCDSAVTQSGISKLRDVDNIFISYKKKPQLITNISHIKYKRGFLNGSKR